MSFPTEQKENHNEQIWNESNLFIFIAAHILILEMNLVWCKKPKQRVFVSAETASKRQL